MVSRRPDSQRILSKQYGSESEHLFNEEYSRVRYDTVL